MILVDLQQTAIASFMMYYKTGKLGPGSTLVKQTTLYEDTGNMDDKTDLEILRHSLLMALRSYRKLFQKYGDLVLCCDSEISWRKSVFPFYKIKRKKSRDGSVFDWVSFQKCFTTIKEEFRENLPYKLIEADGAEGDDVISVLCEANSHKRTPEPILIYSSDKDFLQLQKYPEVKQYDKIRDRYLVTENPLFDLREKIIRGDPGDGIPNILSPDNSFAVGIKQRPIMTAKVEVWKKVDPVFSFTGDDLERYERNRRLIDLSCIPDVIKGRIASSYLGLRPAPRGNVYKYLMKVREADLLSSAGDF